MIPKAPTARPGNSPAPTPAARQEAEPAGQRSRHRTAALVALAALAVLVGGIVWSVSIGPVDVGLGGIVSGIIGTGHSTGAVIVNGIRLPRALLAVLVGANCAVAGVIMQGITANPLGAPEILGINSGAALVAVASITFVPALAGVSLIALAFVGAALCGLVVLVMAGLGRGRTDPVRLALAGVTMTALLASVTQAMIIFYDNSADSVFHWIVGGVNLATWPDVHTILPWAIAGLVVAMGLAGKLNLLGLGEDLARGLGAHIGRIRVVGALCVIVLAGSAVAVAGPILFIGLIVPHIVRRLVGSNNYLVIPISAIVGAVLLVYADNASQYINPGAQVPSGVVTAVLGAPVFIYLARRQKVARG
jgi:ferric citrate transport system permease protein